MILYIIIHMDYTDMFNSNKTLFVILFFILIFFILISLFYLKNKEKIEAFMRLYNKTPKEVENYSEDLLVLR